MSALITLLTVLILSLLITRLATSALMLTGVSHQLARLQALSALTGVGFTTTESERIVEHPLRRRVLIMMMIVGNAGFVTEATTLILSFAGVSTRGEGLLRLGWLLGGLGAIWMVASNQWIERHMLGLMGRALQRWTDLDAYDFVELLEMDDGYRVRAIAVDTGDWVEGRKLAELSLFDEGITVLGIHRADRTYVGIPRGETLIRAGDRMVLYGRADRFGQLENRRLTLEGAENHRQAVADHQRLRDTQQRGDEERSVDALAERSPS